MQNSLAYIEKKAYEVYNVMKKIKGVEDMGIIRNIGQPELRIDLDQNKMAFYGVTTADANALGHGLRNNEYRMLNAEV